MKVRLFNVTYAEYGLIPNVGVANSVELYDKFNVVCANVSNVSYCCEANHCNSRIKQLVHAHYACQP